MSPDVQSSAPKTCPVEMADLEPCGRPIHPTLRDVDEEPVCMMHSRDPNKDKQLFRQEIDAILNDTSRHHRPTGRFDFREFVFPEADFGGTTFTRVAVFMGTTFTQDADFSDAKFARYAHFS